VLDEQSDGDGGGLHDQTVRGGLRDDDDRGADVDAAQRAGCCRQCDRAPSVDPASRCSPMRLPRRMPVGGDGAVLIVFRCDQQCGAVVGADKGDVDE
jgi:hypothetical protein